jgi:hypothetical protein
LRRSSPRMVGNSEASSLSSGWRRHAKYAEFGDLQPSPGEEVRQLGRHRSVEAGAVWPVQDWSHPRNRRRSVSREASAFHRHPTAAVPPSDTPADDREFVHAEWQRVIPVLASVRHQGTSWQISVKPATRCSAIDRREGQRPSRREPQSNARLSSRRLRGDPNARSSRRSVTTCPPRRAGRRKDDIAEEPAGRAR